MVVTGPVGKLFGNLESYPVHNQIHGLVPIELYALVQMFVLVTGYRFPKILKNNLRVKS